jgi:hypothetical protein
VIERSARGGQGCQGLGCNNPRLPGLRTLQ